MSEPTSITRDALDERIRSEVARLDGDDLAWWRAHRVEPFVVARDGFAHYGVAKTDGPDLIFFDSHDAFGRYYGEERWHDGLRLYTDLVDAVRHLALKERMSRTLSETAASLLRLGLLDRGYDDLRRRALEVLAALQADAAVAVPELIEIMSDEKACCGLQERAVATLSAVGPKAAPALPKLIDMAERNAWCARAWCLMALRNIGPAAAPAVPLLIDLLLGRVEIDPDPEYVLMAADALGQIGAIEALPHLLQVLQETDDSGVAREVAEAIGKLGPGAAGAEPLLVDLAGDRPERNRFYEVAEVREAAREALRRIVKPRTCDPPASTFA